MPDWIEVQTDKVSAKDLSKTEFYVFKLLLVFLLIPVVQ